jgi:glycosyltransferase involved in cell wall biosynthesis
MKKRVQPRDIICHPFGDAHEKVVEAFPDNFHVETGIGYPRLMKNSFKIFESYAWLHYHLGKENRQGAHYDFVIPNYFDLSEWEPNYTPGDYIAFLGRIGTSKGLDTIYEIAKRIDMKIVLCGQGDPSPWRHHNIEYRGPISGRARSDFLRNAYCAIMPTTFVEPFGGSGVEAMLCGTPIVAVDYGAFTETVQIGVTGFRCKVLKQWLGAIQSVRKLDRKVVADTARNKYSLETCGAMYHSAFRQIDDLNEYGWYTVAIQKQDKNLRVRAPMGPLLQDLKIPITVTEPITQPAPTTQSVTPQQALEKQPAS